MSRFIETDDGDFLNLDHVRAIKTNALGKRYAVTVNEEHYDCNYQFTTSTITISKILAPVIPAQEGFRLLTVYFGSEISVPENIEEYISSELIIGWRIGEFEPEAITLDEYNNANVIAVLSPDGHIISQADFFFCDKTPAENWKSFVTEIRERWQSHIVREAEEKAAAKAVKIDSKK